MRNTILSIIEREWPTTITHIAKSAGLDPTQNKNIARIKYHVDKLAQQGHIQKKKIGPVVIVWPTEIEKLRVIHELVR